MRKPFSKEDRICIQRQLVVKYIQFLPIVILVCLCTFFVALSYPGTTLFSYGLAIIAIVVNLGLGYKQSNLLRKDLKLKVKLVEEVPVKMKQNNKQYGTSGMIAVDLAHAVKKTSIRIEEYQICTDNDQKYDVSSELFKLIKDDSILIIEKAEHSGVILNICLK